VNGSYPAATVVGIGGGGGLQCRHGGRANDKPLMTAMTLHDRARTPTVVLNHSTPLECNILELIPYNIVITII